MFDKVFLSSVFLVAHGELAGEYLLQGSLWKHEPYGVYGSLKQDWDKVLF